MTKRVSTPPTLACVITNFNYGRYLPQSLDSVLAQTKPFDEIVVVDDGSTDNSLEVLTGYADRVRILTITNSGQLGAGRAGLAATTSHYVYFLDADDVAEPGLVAGIQNALARSPAKLQFQLDGMDDEGRLRNSAFPTYPADYNAAAMRVDNARAGFYICPSTSGNVYARDALLRLDLAQFDPRGAIDGSPTLALPYLGEIVSINAPFARYRAHVDSVSAWSRPSVALLERELSTFRNSWDEVRSALGDEQLPLRSDSSVYVRERRLMIACLSGKTFIIHLALGFILGLQRTHLPPRQKAMFSTWAMLLSVPSAPLRQYLIRAKRSSLNRSRRLQTVLNAVLGIRRRAM